MHHALYIEEILVNIFSHCYVIVFCWPPRRTSACLRRHRYANSHLVALARTCQMFKEPALNLLWAELDDLKPLVQCLPETSWTESDGIYSLRGPLDAADWDIILGYAHRVRAFPCLRGSSGLSESCIKALSSLPASALSLFPNLRVVGLHDPGLEFAPLLPHLINPQLTDVSLERAEVLDILSFGEGCPLVTDFYLSRWSHADTVTGLVRRWPDLSHMNCYDIGLTAHTLSHLSYLRNLVYVAFTVVDTVADRFPSNYSLLTFTTLRDIGLSSSSLTQVWKLLCQFRLPSIHGLSIGLSLRPSVSDLMSFYLALKAACMHHDTLNRLTLRAYSSDDAINGLPSQGISPHYITFDRLRPLTTFTNIKDLTFDIPCSADISERELLCLVSSWPHLEILEIGEYSDWTASSALTPGGFLQLLERCRSLRVLFYMLDTRGYTEIPQGHPWRGLTMRKGAFIHLLHSPIEEESIEALSVFFHAAPYPTFNLTTHWNSRHFPVHRQPRELRDLYHDRWTKVYSLGRDLWEQRRNLDRELRGQNM